MCNHRMERHVYMRLKLTKELGDSSSETSDAWKEENKAAVLKEQGNIYFKKRELKQALHSYAEAAFLSLWPSRERQRLLSQFLGCLEPPKQHIATKLFPCEQIDDERSLLAVCLGNRSAVLYEMSRLEECLADIELGLSLDFPVTSEHKLYRRRACCLAQLGNRAGAIEALETCEKKLLKCAALTQTQKDQLVREMKTYHKKVENLLQDQQRDMTARASADDEGHTSDESKSIIRDSCPEKGRFLRAGRSFSAGEVVISEKAYAAVLNFDLHLTHCSYCFRKTSALIPCCWCISDGYCSSTCREKAWLEYHWLECSVSHLWVKADWMMRLALRMVVSAPATVLLGALTEKLDEAEVYASIMSLVSHEDKFSDTQQVAMFTKMTDTLMECFGDVIMEYLTFDLPLGCDSECLRKLFLHHLLQLRCNTHSMTAVMGESEEGGGGEGGNAVQSSREIHIGSVIFPTASLFNHSCLPNIFFRFVGSSVVVMATTSIEKGDELNNCYGLQAGRMKRAERLAELQRKYFFKCSCPACSLLNDSLEYQEMVVDAYSCQKCHSGGPLGRRGTIWQCHHCLRIAEDSEIERLQELVSETDRMFRAAQDGGGEVDVPLLLKCHRLQSQVLYEHNIQFARTNDALGRAYACLGEFVKAAEFCNASCKAVEVVYGSQSIELATELHKLAQLLFNGGQFAKVFSVVDKALPLLKVYLPPSHPDIIELQRMKLCVPSPYF